MRSASILFVALCALCGAVLAEDTEAVYTVNYYERQALRHEKVGNYVERLHESSGVAYDCYIPPLSRHSEEEPIPRSIEVAADELFTDTPLDAPCLYLIDDWWTYEYCPLRHVRQIHREGTRTTVDHLLGLYDETKPTIVKRGSLFKGAADIVYARQVFVNGTACDVHPGDRMIEMQFFCDERARPHLSFIEEVQSCRYRLGVVTPQICSHPAFAPSLPTINAINCFIPADATSAA